MIDSLTEAQVETMARLYCKHLGVDPDGDANPIGVAAGFPSGIPKWWVARDEVRRAHAMRKALEEYAHQGER